jgi:hypothetical protein
MKRITFTQLALVFFCATSLPLLPALNLDVDFDQLNYTPGTSAGRFTAKLLKPTKILHWKIIRDLQKLDSSADVFAYVTNIKERIAAKALTDPNECGKWFWSKLLMPAYIKRAGLRTLDETPVIVKLDEAIEVLSDSIAILVTLEPNALLLLQSPTPPLSPSLSPTSPPPPQTPPSPLFSE